MSSPTKSATETLAGLVCSAQFNDLSDLAKVRTREHVKDCLGVALAGSCSEPGRVILEVAGEFARHVGARVIGSTIVTSPWEAAWSNGTLSHLLDFDDNGFSHPTAAILPAALAAGELVGASGEEFMIAMVVGWEVFERISRSTREHQPSARKIGFHPTSIIGCPSAAAAASRLLGLTQDQTEVALGLASSASGGLSEQFGTWGKGTQAGNAARAGVMAAILAKRGYFGARTVIEGEHGLLSAFFGQFNIDLIEDQPAGTWAIESPGLNIKRFPACGGTARGISAALELREQVVSNPEDIDRITVEGSESLFHTLHIDVPSRGFEGKFCLRFCIAAAFADGEVTVDTFTDESLGRPLIQNLMKKINISVAPGGFQGGVMRYRTPVAVHMNDGTTASTYVDTPLGNAANRMSYEQITEKFTHTASKGLSSAGVSKLNDTVDHLEVATVRELVDCLTGEAS